MKTRFEVYKGKYHKKLGYQLGEHINTFYADKPIPTGITYRLRKIFSLFGIVILTVHY